jgi:S1-C subfamily serine protease
MHRTIGKRATLGLIALALSLMIARPALAQESVYRRTLSATGWVVIPVNETSSRTGTCWVVDLERRLAITNEHVVRGADTVRVYFPQWQENELIGARSWYKKQKAYVQARVLARHFHKDLALIELATLPEGVTALPLAASSPAPGQTVHSIGNSGRGDDPLWTYRTGRVLRIRTHASRNSDGFVSKIRMIESNSNATKGDSGGPVVNNRGELVGVVKSYNIRRPSTTNSIDIKEIRRFLQRATALTQTTR